MFGHTDAAGGCDPGGVFPVPGREGGDLGKQKTQPTSQDGESMSHNVHISMQVTQIPGGSGTAAVPVWAGGAMTPPPPPPLKCLIWNAAPVR